MGEGLHYLAYSLTRDPAEEIRGALAEASAKSWSELQSLDKIVEQSLPEGIEAEVADAPVAYEDNGATYQTEAVELPPNYQDSGYNSSTDDDDADVSYSGNVDTAWEQAGETYERQVEERVRARILKLGYEERFVSSEQKERVENYTMVVGFGMNCILYDIKAATQ
jgi:hypothetical protein